MAHNSCIAALLVSCVLILCAQRSKSHAKLSTDPSACDVTEAREDCGYYGITAQECQARGCCWAPTTARSSHAASARKLHAASGPAAGKQGAGFAGLHGQRGVGDVPWCFHPNAHSQDHYIVQSLQETELGYSLTLAPDSGRAAAQAAGLFGPSFPLLQVDVAHETRTRLRVRVAPANSSRWEVPRELVARPPPPEARPSDPALTFHPPALGAPFSFAITRSPQGPPQRASQQQATGDHPRMTQSAGSTGGPQGSTKRYSSSSTETGTYSLRPGDGYIAGVTKEGDGGAEKWLSSTGEVGAVQSQTQPPDPPLLDTEGHGLVFKEQYIEFGTAVPQASGLYGLGDTVQPEGWRLVRDGRTVTLWAADAYAGTPRHNIYSAHPFWMEVRADGSSHGAVVLNSNAMDVSLEQDSLKFRITGGVLDMYIFAGPTPEEVVEQYHELVGRPGLPPRWALGFHQCKWGYHDVGTVEAVVANYRGAGLPLEAMWTDIDYMDRHRDFTLDPDHFPLPGMRRLVESLHAAHQHWVPIIDPGIPLVPGYDAYERGLTEGVFVRDRGGGPLLGEVWPGPTHWPDFLHPSTPAYWSSLLRGLWEQVAFDGLWIDMNEPSNFCPGDVCWLPAAPPPPPATRNGSSGLRAGHPSAQPLHEQQEQQERQQQMQMQQRQQQQEQRRRQQMRADAVVAGSPGSPRTKTVGELRHSLRGGQVRQGATAAIQQQVRQGAAAAAATAATARVAGGAAGGDLGGDPAATAEATIALRAAPKGRRTAIGTAAVGNPAGDFAATTPKPATTEMDTGAGTAAAAGAAGAGAVNSVGVRPRGRAAERRAHAAQNCEIQCKQADPDDRLSHPPYAVNNQNSHLPLGWQTLPPSALHYGGVTHYDAHNLYGLAEAKVTAEALRNLTGGRAFILTRSTFPGSGAHAARWTGDNAADWDNLRWSIPALFSSWAWGIPQSGSDICGFRGGSSPELCARWLAAGSFYTFVRNHANLDSPPQEAYVWPEAAAAARTALRLRYALLPYLYTQHYISHKSGGGVARPLLSRWPGFEEARGGKASDQQWLLGDSVMVVPVLEPGVREVRDAWIPPGAWFSAEHDGGAMQVRSLSTGPARVSLPAPLDRVPVLLQEGTVIPLHSPGLTTHDVVRTPLTLLALLRREPCTGRGQAHVPHAGGAAAAHEGDEQADEMAGSWCAVDWRRVDAGGAPPKTALYRTRATSARNNPDASPQLTRTSRAAVASRGVNQQPGPGSGSGPHEGVHSTQLEGVSGLAHLIQAAQTGFRQAGSASKPTGSQVWEAGEVEVAAGTLYADDGGHLNPGEPGASIEAWVTALVPAAAASAAGQGAAGFGGAWAGNAAGAAGGGGTRNRWHGAGAASVHQGSSSQCALCVGRLVYQVVNPRGGAGAAGSSPAPGAGGAHGSSSSSSSSSGSSGRRSKGLGASGENSSATGTSPNDGEDDETAALHALSMSTITLMPLDLPEAPSDGSGSSSDEMQVLLNGAALPQGALTWNAAAGALTVQLPAGTSAWQDFVLEWGPAA